MDERDGAVDGVDDPAKAGRAGLFAELFTEDGVVGKGGVDEVASEGFGATVGDSDGRAVALGFEVEVWSGCGVWMVVRWRGTGNGPSEPAEREARGFERDLPGEGHSLLESVVVHGPMVVPGVGISGSSPGGDGDRYSLA